MARKIFVSYKHGDKNVAPLPDYEIDNYKYTARSYVDYLIKNLLDDEIYKGEGDEDLSEFKDETIENRLKNKIHDSSITLVLISPNMKELSKESDQWIPWEISYSLKEITRNDKMSHTNGILAIVLPDKNGKYDYYIQDNTCEHCNCRTLRTNTLFQILKENMFNINNPTFNDCPYHPENNPVYTGESSYIKSVKWEDFLNNKEDYLKKIVEIRDNRKSYDITKEIKNG